MYRKREVSKNDNAGYCDNVLRWFINIKLKN